MKDSYLDDLRNLWDLYTTDSTVDAKMLSSKTYEDTTAEFSTGKVAFYQNGVWSTPRSKAMGWPTRISAWYQSISEPRARKSMVRLQSTMPPGP